MNGFIVWFLSDWKTNHKHTQAEELQHHVNMFFLLYLIHPDTVATLLLHMVFFHRIRPSLLLASRFSFDIMYHASPGNQLRPYWWSLAQSLFLFLTYSQQRCLNHYHSTFGNHDLPPNPNHVVFVPKHNQTLTIVVPDQGIVIWQFCNGNLNQFVKVLTCQYGRKIRKC